MTSVTWAGTPQLSTATKNDGSLLADRQGASPQAGVDPLVLARPTSITGQQRRVRRGDVELGRPDLNRLPPAECRDQEDREKGKTS